MSVFNIIFVSSHMYPENPEGTQVIVGSMNMGYISDIARNRTHNPFRPKCAPIPLGHSDGQWQSVVQVRLISCVYCGLVLAICAVRYLSKLNNNNAFMQYSKNAYLHHRIFRAF